MKSVIINCFDTYQHRVDLLAEFLGQKDWDVLQIRSDFSHRNKARVPHDATRKDVVFLSPKPYQKNLSAPRLRSHHDFAADCAAYLESMDVPPDLLWVLLPPNSLAKACARYKHRHPDVKLIFDLIDLWPETFPLGGVKWLPPFRIWRHLRDRNLPAADHIVTECELFRTKLALPPANSTTIYMCKRDCFPDAPYALPCDDAYALCYLGSVNHIIDIDAISNIIKELSVVRPVTLHIIGQGESLGQLLDAATRAGACVQYHGAIYDREEKQKIFDQCHFGLNVMKASVCIGLTMKSIDYLAGGLPLINTIPGDTWELVEQYQFGVNWTSDTAAALQSFDLCRAREHARSYFSRELTYSRFAQKVDAVIRRLAL